MKRLVLLMLLWPLTVYAKTQTAPEGNAQPAPPGSVITAPSGTGLPPHSCPSGEWYPPAAVANHEQGTTLLAFRIGVDGTPKDITVSATSGFADLDQVAIACASQFKYHPATQDSQPVEVPWKLRLVWDIPQSPEPIGPAHDCRDEANKMPQDHPIGLHIVVGSDGNVKRVDLSIPSSDAALDQDLIACISKWQYKPGIRFGKPAEWNFYIPLTALEFVQR